MSKINVEYSTDLGEELIEVGRQMIPAGVELLAIGLRLSDDVALDQFEVRGIIGHEEFTFAEAQADFETPVWPLERASGDLTALAEGDGGYVVLDVRALAAVSVFAASSAFSAEVATGVLTASANAADGDTVEIGDVTYVFNETALVDEPYNVLIGATASDTLDNLIDAINGEDGAGEEGTVYGTGTLAHAFVEAVAGIGDTVDISALVGGRAGNDIGTSADSATLSFGAETLEGGLGPTRITVSFYG